MASYRLSQEAQADLYRIWLYGHKRWGLEKADQYISAFFERFDEITDNPLLYPPVDEIRAGYRRSVCGVDSIFYRVDAQGEVEFMAIIGHQDSDQWL